MLTNIKSESNAPFLKSTPLAHKIIFFENAKVDLSLTSNYSNGLLVYINSCTTAMLANIKHRQSQCRYN